MNLFRFGMACTVLAVGLVCGCVSPSVAKLAKPKQKINQDEFSCGEKTPPRLKEAPLH